MLEIITGLVLAAAAGLNAYIPLLGLGLLARLTGVVNLPENWQWLAADWTLIVLGVLLIMEILVDKFPVLDTVNDILQTVVRPASGGIVFAAGIGSQTAAVSDPLELFESGAYWPVVIGVLVALVPHLLKALARPALNAVTGGVGAAVISTAEDIGAALLTLFAVIVPVVALLLLALLAWWAVRKLRKTLARRNTSETAA